MPNWPDVLGNAIDDRGTVELGRDTRSTYDMDEINSDTQEASAMSYDDILYEIEDGIATITLNRPQVMNALSPSLEGEMHRAFDEADLDRNVRVIILTGAGAAFCAGYDQGPSQTGRTRSDPTGRTIADYIEDWQRGDGETADKWVHMWKLGKPIIAAVNGWAMGGGFWY